MNGVFADGSARFLRQEMDYLVYIAIMTTRGAEAKTPGTTTPVLDAERQLVGVVSLGDVSQAVAQKAGGALKEISEPAHH